MKVKSRLLASLTVGAMLSAAAIGVASAATIDAPEGPLTQINISEDLNCDVRYLGDSEPEFFGGDACGTFVAAAGTLYGPAIIPAGGSANPRTGWTKVSQTEGGTGVAGNPFTITTVVTGGALEVTQVDTYVVGQNSYRSDISVKNTSAAALDAVAYRAADCYLQDSDHGYGEYDAATGAVLCRAPDSNGEHSAAGRIEEFVPLTAGSNFLYGGFDEVWRAVGSQLPFPNEVLNGDSHQDNGMGLSWSLNVPAGQTKTVSVLTNFSPLGEVSLPSSLVVDTPTIAQNERATLSASVTNPNLTVQTLSSLTVTLPSAVDYVAGSATVVGEPTVSSDGRTLTFAGPFAVAADGTVAFEFDVVGATVGTENLTLAGTTVGGAPVLTSTAAITVEPGEPVEVVLANPVVTQASCAATGAIVAPEVELPASTNLVTYELEGVVAPGSTVTVIAYAEGNGYLPEAAEGWTMVESERPYATMEITLDPIECSLLSVPVAPVSPTVTQATCDAAPAVKLAETEGVTYSGVPATLKAGDKFTVTATPADGFMLEEAEGWTLNEDGTATQEITLAEAPSCPTEGGLAETGASPMVVALSLASVALIGAGVALVAVRRNRNA